jgi:hypothetical protein
MVAAISLIMEAVRASETSVYSNETTRRYIPEGSNLHTRRRENPKSHTLICIIRKRYVEVGVLGCNAVWTCTKTELAFRRNMDYYLHVQP